MLWNRKIVIDLSVKWNFWSVKLRKKGNAIPCVLVVSSNVPCAGDQCIYGHVNGHNVCSNIGITVHCSQYSGSGAGNNTSWPIQIINIAKSEIKMHELSHIFSWFWSFFSVCNAYPTTGSRTDDVTIAGRNIPIGRFLPFIRIKSSDNAFVNAYVFGHLPNMLRQHAKNSKKNSVNAMQSRTTATKK